jgi:hypothetical protein
LTRRIIMAQDVLAPGTTLKGRFTVTRLIGGGGMARVYQVEERRADGPAQAWAMKELRLDNQDAKAEAEAYQLFEQEAHILASLDHPHLPDVCAFFSENRRSYLVMEFIPGESLKKRLETANAPILESQALDWAIQICEVLDYLHSLNPPIIFRDMKPSNVMITPQGVIKLIDFGIARTYKQGKMKDTLAMGSENYAAPEQWGKAQSDARTDLYALGATLYHLLTNTPPMPAFVPAVSQPIRDYNPAVSEATVRAVEKAMSREREKRFRSAQEMRAALIACLPASLRASYAQPRNAAKAQRPQPVPATRQVAQAAPQIAPPPVSVQPQVAATRPTPPPRACPRCQTANPAEARFCRRCGYSFAGLRPGFVRIIQPPGVTWEMPIRDKSLLIGREPTADKQVPCLDLDFYDPKGYLSRRHAVIMRNEKGYFISDMGSENGSWVNGVRLAPRQPQPLRNGDEIQLAQVKLRFELR